MSRKTLESIARLALVSAFSIVLLVIDALHFEGEVQWGIVALAAVLWLIILGDFVAGLVRAEDKRGQLLQHLGYPILLVAPLLIFPYLTPILALALLVAYILELRQLTAGQGFVFSAVLVCFVAVVATGFLVYAESQDPQSELGDWQSAGLWTLANLLRIRSVGTPTTEDGEFVSYVVGICALLVASLFTAQIVAWVIGSQKDDSKEADQARKDLADELSALRSAVEELNTRLDREQREDARSSDGASGPADEAQRTRPPSGIESAQG